MSVFNDVEFVGAALESILGQTFRDFELLVIDDASADGSAAVLGRVEDDRLRVIRNETNLGLTRSLVKGLAEARGRYVARMDADDVALPDRLERQVAFMEAHPDVGILGGDCELIDVEGRPLGPATYATTDLEIRWRSLLANPFAHPTVMLRRDVLTRSGISYDPAFRTAQDYDLWVRLLGVTRGANLGEPLLRYRMRHGVTSRHRRSQLENHDAIALRSIRQQCPAVSVEPEQVSALRSLVVGGGDLTPQIESRRVGLAGLYLRLLESFAARHAGVSGTSALGRREVVRIAKIGLRPPWRVGTVALVLRLARAARLPRGLVGYAGDALDRRRGRLADVPSRS
jgi:hypothetical protein